MIITCLHGYFMFKEETNGEIARFNTYYDQDLKHQDDYYTFDALTDFPEYCVLGKPIINLPAITTYVGRPWEILEENKFVYSYLTGFILPLYASAIIIEYTETLEYVYNMGLIQPGNITKMGKIITGYQCRLDLKTLVFKYTELFYDQII